MGRWAFLIFLTVPTAARAEIVSYDADVFPEAAGFTRFYIYDPERWLADGWFFQHIDQGGGTGEPYDGDYDDYRDDLSPFADSPFFIEWRLMSDAPNSEVDWHNGGASVVAYGAGVNYHFNIANGLARLVREYPYPPLYFDIEPGIPHTYRLEVYGDDYFQFLIDGAIVEEGAAGDAFPNPYAELLFGAGYYLSEHTTQWDYVRFGEVPEPATGLWLLLATMVVLRRRGTRKPGQGQYVQDR